MHFQDFNPMRFAVAGDWHANTLHSLDAVDYLHAKGIRHIIHTGDFGYDFDSRKFLRPLTQQLIDNDQYIWFIDGNHEDYNKLLSYDIGLDQTRRITSRITHLPRGFRWEWNGVKMLALGGAFSVDKEHRVPGVSWWPEEEINWDEAERVCNGGHADFMFTHDCPAGVNILSIKYNPMGLPNHVLNQAENHRNLLRQIVDEVKPDRLYHGHYHERYDGKLWGNDYTTQIIGLDCDGAPMKLNTIIVDL